MPTVSQTGAMNMVLVDPMTGKMYLLQMICNFRATVTSYSTPYKKSLEGILNHMDRLNEALLKSYVQIYSGKPNRQGLPLPLNLSIFYTDDLLGKSYKTINLQQQGKDPKVLMEALVLPIGYSHTFSLSAPIHALNKLRDFLCFDQLIELCFVCLSLNSHLQFDYCMMQLLNEAQEGRCAFGVHPF